MVKKYNNIDSRLEVVEQLEGSAMALSNKAKLSLYKKSVNSNIPLIVLEEVYHRGYSIWNESFGDSPEQFAFDRVNSFISGGFALNLDKDLLEEKEVWEKPNPVKKHKHLSDAQKSKAKSRAKSNGRPYPNMVDNMWASRNEETSNRSVMNIIKEVINEKVYGICENCDCEMSESAAWQRKEGKDEKGGLNKKGVESYRREHPGSKLKTAVTKKPSELKAGSKDANRRKSFCARMSGMKKRLTSDKTANDPDSRINKSLRKWHCEDVEQVYEAKMNVNNLTHRDIVKDHAEPNGFSKYREGTEHSIYKHSDGRTIQIPRHKGDLAPGTSRQIMKVIYNKTRNESYTGAEQTSNDTKKPNSRFIGTDNIVKTYKKETPYSESVEDIIKRIIVEKQNNNATPSNYSSKEDDPENTNDYRLAHVTMGNVAPKTSTSGFLPIPSGNMPFTFNKAQSDLTPKNATTDPDTLKAASDLSGIKKNWAQGDPLAGSRYDAGDGDYNVSNPKPNVAADKVFSGSRYDSGKYTDNTDDKPALRGTIAPDVPTGAPKVTPQAAPQSTAFQFSNAAKTGKGTVGADELNNWKKQQSNPNASYGDFLNAARGYTKKNGK